MRFTLKAFLLAVVLTAIGSAQSQAAFVTNGGFEMGNFTGWTQFGNTGFTGVQSGAFGGVPPHSGNFQAFFGPVGSTGGISQSITGLTVGDSYNLSFWLHNFGGTPNFFSAIVDGNTAFTGTNLPAQPYTLVSYNFTASNTSTSLVFTTQQNPSFFLLDSVSVTANAVPAPAGLLLGLTGLPIFGVVARLRRRNAVQA